MKQPNLSNIHYRYVIFILSLIIVSLLTFKYAPETSLFNYVAFAATIASLILAILAIIQGFISSNALSNTENNINEASNKIINSANQLEVVINSLDKKVEEIPILLKGIDSKLNITTEFLNPINQGKRDNDIKISKEVFDQFIETSSQTGILTLYTCVLGFKYKKSLKLSDLNYDPYIIDWNYNYGFIVACHCMSLITIKVITTTPKEIKVIKLDDNLNNTENLIELFISNDTGIKHKEKLLQAKKTIEDMFIV